MRKQELWKGLVAGSAAGLAGAIAMTQLPFAQRASDYTPASGAVRALIYTSR